MSEPPILDRLTNLIHRESDLISELQELSADIAAHAERLRLMNERLQRRLEPSVEADIEAEVFKIPTALMGGPSRRE